MTIAQQFQRKRNNPDGTPSQNFLINEELVAMMDWLVASCLSAEVAEARGLNNFYKERVNLYKHLNGSEGRRDWRKELVAVLESWLERFPAVLRRANSSLCEVSPGDLYAEVEQVAVPPSRYC